MYKKFVKRFLDIVISFTAILLLLPVMLVISVAVGINMGSPIIFRQRRPGKNEKTFEMYKFRSMTNGKDKNGKILSDEIRLTNFGKKLRASSLDELPELFNILKGDMSIIGPRPLLEEYLPYYTEAEKKRHEVRPGLTGLAQISGRNYLKWDRRLEKDIEYVNHISFCMDLKILLKTIYIVINNRYVAEIPDEIEGNLAEIRKNMRNGN